MKKISLASCFSKKNTVQNERRSREKRSRARTLRLESLESRELLSVSPGSEFQAADASNIYGFINGRFTVDEAIAAYESSVASRADDVLDIAENMLDGAEARTDASVRGDSASVLAVDAQETLDSELDATAAVGVSGPGEPTVYYDADQSERNTGDDNLCWAAAASNMLWHTGWASVADAQNEQELFDFYFVDSWPNDVGCAEDALSWFLNDEYRYSFTQAAYANAGYYSRLMGHYGETASDYVSVYSALQSDALQTLSANLRNGDAVGLFVDVHNDQENGRAITCWGYAVDASYSPTDPRYYSGLYITDSDDETEGKNNDRLNERALVYVDLEWRDDIPQLSSGDETVGEYLLGGYDDRTGDSRYYLVNFTTLKQRPEKYASAPDAETRSTVVTTADDVYDIYDGEISLREALDNARSGDTVSFADSLKGKTISLDPKRGELTIKKSITVDASNLWDAETAAPGLTINGQGNSGILSLNQGLEVEFNGITLTNGHSDSGGAIYCGSSALALNNCVVANNIADVDGGGVYVASGGSLVATNCVFRDNEAEYGGGVCSFGETTLDNCTVANNAAGDFGGGVYVDALVSFSATNCVFRDNEAISYGGGVCASGDVAIVNCLFENNTTGKFGGAIYFDRGVGLVATHCAISNNKAEYGGGIYAFGDAILDDCVAANNTAVSHGGGVFVDSGAVLTATNCALRDNEAEYGGGVCSFGETTLNSCVAMNNSVGECGGAIFVNSDSVLAATNSLFAGNDASHGAGLGLFGNATLHNCTIANNAAKRGGGVDLDAAAVFNAYATIVVGNSAEHSGPDVNFCSSDAVANAFNTLSSYSDWADGANNLTYDASRPLFANAETGDYALADGSQAIDKGDVQYVTSSVDLAGISRVFGETVDLGAYEYQIAAPSDLAFGEYDFATLTLPMSWTDNSNNETKFVAQFSYDGVKWNRGGETAANVASRVATKVAPNRTYYFRVAAFNDFGASDWVYGECQTPPATPAAPTDLVFSDYSPENRTVQMSWTDNSDDETNFVVQYSVDGGATWRNSAILDADVATRTATGISENRVYLFRVAARNAYGLSDWLEGAFEASNGTNPDLAAPTDLVFSDYSSAKKTVRMSWTDSSDNETSFVVQYSVDGGFSWRESATLDANSTSRVATGLTPDRVYRFRVAASNELGRSEWLYGVFEASTQLNANLPAPSDLTFVNYSSESRTVDMSWTDNSDDESGFVVQYRVDGGATWRASANLDANATSRVATGIVAGRVYEFRVAAVNALGYSEWLYGSFTASNEEIASSSATVDCRRKNEESGYSVADFEIELAESSSFAPAAALLAAYEDASLFEDAPTDDAFELLDDAEFPFVDVEF